MRPAPLPSLLLQQVVLAAALGAAMRAVQAITGHALRGLADAPGAGELAAYAVVTTLLAVASVRLVARVHPAAPLAWRTLAGRPGAALAGFAVGAALNAAPWLLALARGDARVTAWRPDAAGCLPLLLGLALAWWNAGFEEVTSRAVPHQLLRGWRPAPAAALAAACFALMHGIGESLTPSRLLYLWSLGVVLSGCWLATRRVALGTGVHAGWFRASFLPSGRFASGALLAVEGRVGPYVQWTDRLLFLTALGGLAWWHRAARAEAPSP